MWNSRSGVAVVNGPAVRALGGYVPAFRGRRTMTTSRFPLRRTRAVAAPAAGVLVLVLAGCAAQPNPIIDTKGVDMAAYRRDLAECEQYANEVPMATGAAKGAVAGGAYGAAVGSINGRAAEGAGTGAITGAAVSMLDADREKQRIVKRCIAGRGYRVLN
jgi:outer membrane lipoprotein SlyB